MTIIEALTNVHSVLMTVNITIPQGKIILESFQLINDRCKLADQLEQEKDKGEKPNG